MDGGTWWASVHGVAKNQTRLSDFTFTFHFPALEKEMATHSRVLAWRIPGTVEPGGLPSMGSHRVGHDWRDLAAVAVDGKESACNAEDQIQSLDQEDSLVSAHISLKVPDLVWSRKEDSLKKGIAAHSSIPEWRIPWTEEPGGLQPVRSQRVGHDWVINTITTRIEKGRFRWKLLAETVDSWRRKKEMLFIRSLSVSRIRSELPNFSVLWFLLL